MDEKYCNEGCKYDLWSYSKKEGYAERSCRCCGKISTYPINDYIKQEISKQKIYRISIISASDFRRLSS